MKVLPLPSVRPWHTALGALLCLFLPASEGHAAQPRSLGKPEAELPETDGAIRFVKELSDGRLLIGQAGDAPLLVVDSGFRRAMPVGRRGDGPGEYRIPSTAFVSRDTIWIVDGGTRRLTALSPELKLLSSVSLQGIFAREGLVYSNPIGMDSTGRLLVRTHRFEELANRTVTKDSISLFWLSREPRSLAFLARLRQVPVYSMRGMQETRTRDTVASLGVDPFTADDAAGLTSDGRAVVLRANPYRLEWPGELASARLGPSIDYRAVKITAEDRELIERAHIQVRATAQRAFAAASPRTKVVWENSRWPTEKPPFVGGVRSSERGFLFVQRLRPSSKTDTALYDVLSDRNGRLTFQVDLGTRGRLVGVGAKYLYVVRLDEDDVEYLGRYRY